MQRAGRVRLACAVGDIISEAKPLRLRWTRAYVDASSNLRTICKLRHDAKAEAKQKTIRRVKTASR